jgi:hypothetical protein
MDYGDYSLRPLVFEAASAHRDRRVEYQDDGTVICRHPDLARHGREPALVIPKGRQFPGVRATFDDLNKALSRLSNSPLVEEARTLRQLYEEEAARYDEMAAAAFADGGWEPDYGNYVLDPVKGDLYLIAPERWHRLALVTSNSMLLTDPEARLSWREVRARLEGAVVGFAGVSVGGNILEGWLREARPKRVKVADPDWVETTNLNRGERMSLRHIVASRADRFDARNPYETPRVSKAEYVAYEAQLVDPYAQFFVYKDGLNRSNIERFLLGNGADEPPISILVEEMDNLELKVLVRELCRQHRIDVLMLSDFGHRVHARWNYFRDDPQSTIGYGVPDAVLHDRLAAVRGGDRNKVFDFIAAMCGDDFAGDQFKAWMDGQGEQPTSSLPQSGATAMASGAIGGKECALHILGHHERRDRRIVVYDLLQRTATEG